MTKNLLDPTQQIPGTMSIFSQAKKVNNQSLIQQIWQFDHDPNDSFFHNMIQQKIKRHHSYEDAKHKNNNYGRESINDNQVYDGKNEFHQNQYHSLVQDSQYSHGTKINNQYGLVNNNKRKVSKQYENFGQEPNRDKDMGVNKDNQLFNKMQRVQTVQNKATQHNNNGQNQPNIHKIAINTFPLNIENIKSLPNLKTNPNNNQSIRTNNKKADETRKNNQTQQISQIKTQLFSPKNGQHFNTIPTNNNNNETVQPCRQEEILGHRRTSNINYLIRQTKEMLQLNKMIWLLSEVEEHRKNIMKVQIQCRRLKISLRGSSNGSSLSGTKLSVQKQIRKDQKGQVTALQQYGYIDRMASNNSQDKVRKQLIKRQYKASSNSRQANKIQNKGQYNSSKNLYYNSGRTGSNLIKLQSNVKERQQEISLIIRIAEVKKNMENLKMREQEIDAKLGRAIQRNKSISKINIEINGDATKRPGQKTNRQQREAIQSRNKKKDTSTNSPSPSITKRKQKQRQQQYKQIIFQKRNVIKQSIQQFKQHTRYKLEHLSEENKIMKEQLKIIQQQIYETQLEISAQQSPGYARNRNKFSIGNCSNSKNDNNEDHANDSKNKNKLQPHLLITRKLLVVNNNGHHSRQYIANKQADSIGQQGQKSESRNKKSIIFRSYINSNKNINIICNSKSNNPIYSSPNLQKNNGEPQTKNSGQLLRKVVSEKHLPIMTSSPRIPDSNRNIQVRINRNSTQMKQSLQSRREIETANTGNTDNAGFTDQSFHTFNTMRNNNNNPNNFNINININSTDNIRSKTEQQQTYNNGTYNGSK